MTIKQIVVNCNSTAEATRLGRGVLKKRLAACYDVVPRVSTGYYWPPKKGKLTNGKGATLFITTLPRHVAAARRLITTKHTDRVPFIGTIDVHDVSHEHYRWLVGELRTHA